MKYKELNPEKRILLGPGPSDVPPQVLKAMSTPLIGHLDPQYLQIMDETREMLKEIFKTKNEFTIAMPGTGSAGMETCLVNLLEPGDKALICISGVFGERMADIASRCGAEVHIVECEWGEVIEPKQVKKALEKIGKVKVVALVHAETSTGACQPIEEISRIIKQSGALFVLDTVTSLGGIPVEIDSWKVDAVYSGSQKCLSCPPGLSPVSFSEEAFLTINKRKTKCQSWYLDVNMLRNYWGRQRFYHHTAPISMSYALRESLRLVLEEGLEKRFRRHKINSLALVAGLEAMGLKMIVKKENRLPELNSVYIPENVDDVKIRLALLDKYGIEIGGGLGKFKGRAWRIGLMGYSSRRENVMLFLSALEDVLSLYGYKIKERGTSAAAEIYTKNPF